MLGHTFDHDLKKEIRMMHKLIDNQKIWIIRIQNGRQILADFFVNSGAPFTNWRHETVLYVGIKNVLAIRVAQHVH